MEDKNYYTINFKVPEFVGKIKDYFKYAGKPVIAAWITAAIILIIGWIFFEACVFNTFYTLAVLGIIVGIFVIYFMVLMVIDG